MWKLATDETLNKVSQKLPPNDICKCSFDALDAINKEVVEVERDFIVNKLIRSVEVQIIIPRVYVK